LLCQFPLKVRKSGAIVSRRVFQHVSVHLGKPLFSCRHCSYTGTGAVPIGRHLLNSHDMRTKTAEDFIDHTGDYADEILGLIERCFTPNQNEQTAEVKPPTKRLTRRRSDTSNIYSAPFRYLTQVFKKFGENGKLPCALCSKMFTVRNAMSHVTLHLEKPLYTCWHCSYVVSSQNLPKLIQHERDVHGVHYDYVDHTKGHESELIKMVAACFDKDPSGTLKSMAESRMVHGCAEFRSQMVGSSNKCSTTSNMQVGFGLESASAAANQRVSTATGPTPIWNAIFAYSRPSVKDC